ncbi:hypothetical protein D3C79_1095320 [compost metagenome]
MQDRFIVVNARPLEGVKPRDKSEPPHWAVHGYRILDTLVNKRLPGVFKSRIEAQEECDRRNGK